MPYHKENDLTRLEWPQSHVCSTVPPPQNKKKKPDRDEIVARQILARYNYSKYLVDPNKHSFSSVVRIMAIIFKYMQCLCDKALTRRNDIANRVVDETNVDVIDEKNVDVINENDDIDETNIVVDQTKMNVNVVDEINDDDVDETNIDVEETNVDVNETNVDADDGDEMNGAVDEMNIRKSNNNVETESHGFKPLLLLTDEEITKGRNYYFKKATAEVVHFAKKSDYEKISTKKNDILY